MTRRKQDVCIYSVELIINKLNKRKMHRYIVVDEYYSEDQIAELMNITNKTEASIGKIELVTDFGVHWLSDLTEGK